ncbi:MAG: signal peptide protein [Mycobacterium sp.]|jgi:hypothetical protein|nr:signal peptide protein [Mycobacterium sp.]MDT5109163.1 hypothetical protein [Mycobacterium sp.]
MKKTTTVKIAAAVASCTSGLFLAVIATASPAGADPVDPAPPPAPLVTVPAPQPVPAEAPTVQAAGSDTPLLPPDGTPHLASPDALPPGSTMEPQDRDSPNVSYLKDLWQAVQNHEISGKEALVMGLAQRGMNTPIPDQAPGPNVPISPVDPALAPPPPAPAPLPPAPVGPFPPTP